MYNISPRSARTSSKHTNFIWEGKLCEQPFSVSWIIIIIIIYNSRFYIFFLITAKWKKLPKHSRTMWCWYTLCFYIIYKCNTKDYKLKSNKFYLVPAEPETKKKKKVSAEIILCCIFRAGRRNTFWAGAQYNVIKTERGRAPSGVKINSIARVRTSRRYIIIFFSFFFFFGKTFNAFFPRLNHVWMWERCFEREFCVPSHLPTAIYYDDLLFRLLLTFYDCRPTLLRYV